VTLAVMIVLAAAVAAWVLAPLRGSTDPGVSRLRGTADPHDEWPTGKSDAAIASAGDGARAARYDAPREE
jgi:hypothetical protein